jgi:hypothetical protein
VSAGSTAIPDVRASAAAAAISGRIRLIVVLPFSRGALEGTTHAILLLAERT